VKNEEGNREQKKQVFRKPGKKTTKKLKAVIPVQPKLFGFRQACPARYSLLHMARSDLPSLGKNCLPARLRACWEE